jgi:hypothetical protein
MNVHEIIYLCGHFVLPLQGQWRIPGRFPVPAYTSGVKTAVTMPAVTQLCVLLHWYEMQLHVLSACLLVHKLDFYYMSHTADPWLWHSRQGIDR